MKLRLATLGLLALVAGSCTSTEPASTGNGPKHASEPAAPLIGEVQCLDSGPRVVTSTVRAQPDGVHFRVVNRSDRDLRIRFETGGEWPLSTKPSRLIVGVEPGPASVACHPKGTHARDRDQTAEVLIVDPGGFYGSRELECHATEFVDIFASTTIGDTVEEAARRVLKHPARSQIVHVGYPEAVQVGALVIHNGRAVAELLFIRSPEGDLALEGTRSCAAGQGLLRH